MVKILKYIGHLFFLLLSRMGRMLIFFASSLYWLITPPFKFNRFLRQIHFIGVKSLFVVILTGAFVGMVLSIQVFYTLRKFGGEALLGPAVALSLIRELGPVFSALMITGRGGSAIAAEIGIMRITEQIDALYVMALNPMKYLVAPAILAGVVVFPLLSAIFDLVGIYGGYLVGVKLLGVGGGTYFGEMNNFVNFHDITEGIYKSLSFGVIVTWICCYKGFYADYGAEGVSKATTEAVVMSSVLILVWDYFLASVLF